MSRFVAAVILSSLSGLATVYSSFYLHGPVLTLSDDGDGHDMFPVNSVLSAATPYLQTLQRHFVGAPHAMSLDTTIEALFPLLHAQAGASRSGKSDGEVHHAGALYSPYGEVGPPTHLPPLLLHGLATYVTATGPNEEAKRSLLELTVYLTGAVTALFLFVLYYLLSVPFTTVLLGFFILPILLGPLFSIPGAVLFTLLFPSLTSSKRKSGTGGSCALGGGLMLVALSGSPHYAIKLLLLIVNFCLLSVPNFLQRRMQYHAELPQTDVLRLAGIFFAVCAECVLITLRCFTVGLLCYMDLWSCVLVIPVIICDAILANGAFVLLFQPIKSLKSLLVRLYSLGMLTFFVLTSAAVGLTAVWALHKEAMVALGPRAMGYYASDTGRADARWADFINGGEVGPFRELPTLLRPEELFGATSVAQRGQPDIGDIDGLTSEQPSDLPWLVSILYAVKRDFIQDFLFYSSSNGTTRSISHHRLPHWNQLLAMSGWYNGPSYSLGSYLYQLVFQRYALANCLLILLIPFSVPVALWLHLYRQGSGSASGQATPHRIRWISRTTFAVTAFYSVWFHNPGVSNSLCDLWLVVCMCVSCGAPVVGRRIKRNITCAELLGTGGWRYSVSYGIPLVVTCSTAFHFNCIRQNPESRNLSFYLNVALSALSPIFLLNFLDMITKLARHT